MSETTTQTPLTDAPADQPGVGTGDPKTPETGDGQAGSPQGATEDGQPSGADKAPPKLLVDRNELLGLRSERRELRSRLADLESTLEQIRSQNGNAQADQDSDAPLDDASFWNKPTSAFTRLEKRMDMMGEKFSKMLQESRTQDQKSLELAKEKAEAVKLIHSQQGWNTADDTELIDIIEEYGLGALPPMRGAKAALAIFREEKGIRDTSQKRQRAASVTGAPPGNAGGKVWSRQDMNRILEGWKKDPSKWDDALADEFKLAEKEGRIR